MEDQIKALKDAGAKVETSNDAAARYVGKLMQAIERSTEKTASPVMAQVDLGVLKNPMVGINVGLESFTESLAEQGAQAIHVDWKPMAGSNEKLMGILERMRQK